MQIDQIRERLDYVQTQLEMIDKMCQSGCKSDKYLDIANLKREKRYLSHLIESWENRYG